MKCSFSAQGFFYFKKCCWYYNGFCMTKYGAGNFLTKVLTRFALYCNIDEEMSCL